MHDLIGKEILHQVLEQTRLHKEQVRLLKDILNELRHSPKDVSGITIHRTGESPMKPIVPGTIATYDATTAPVGAPTTATDFGWISSDPINAPLVKPN